MPLKASDFYDTEEFEELLASAECNAKNEWEMQFVSDLRNRYDERKIFMYLSQKQKDILERIVHGD